MVWIKLGVGVRRICLAGVASGGEGGGGHGQGNGLLVGMKVVGAEEGVGRGRGYKEGRGRGCGVGLQGRESVGWGVEREVEEVCIDRREGGSSR